MKLKGSFWFAVFLLALGLFGVIQSLTFVYWESIVLPLAISITIFVLAVVQVARELWWVNKGKEAAAKATATGSDTKADNRRLGLIFGWAAGFSLAIYLLGFYIATPIFAFAYLKWRGRSWLAAAIFAVGTLVFIYSAFELGLKAPLYKGLIFGAH